MFEPPSIALRHVVFQRLYRRLDLCHRARVPCRTALSRQNTPKTQFSPPNDTNAYTLGGISDHNVVIACLPPFLDFSRSQI